MKRLLPLIAFGALALSSCKYLKPLGGPTEADLQALASPADLAEQGVPLAKGWEAKVKVEKKGTRFFYVELISSYGQEGTKGYNAFTMVTLVQQYMAWTSAKTARVTMAMALEKSLAKDGFSFEESKAPEGADWGGDFKYLLMVKDGKKHGCVVTFGSGTKVFAILLRGLYFASASDEHFRAFFNSVYPRMKAHDFAS